MDAAETTSTSCTCGLMILAERCLSGAAPLLDDMSLAVYQVVYRGVEDTEWPMLMAF
jgi:hypothetical protein